ncbi:MAG TPA: hypothetical protein DCY07_00680, partial [Rhodospirillaceae bacterium]|nr:hypothetical protein [Rhodospirillaceae bacterium]
TANAENKEKFGVSVVNFAFNILACTVLAAKVGVAGTKESYRQVRQSLPTDMTKKQAVVWSLISTLMLSPLFMKQSTNNSADVTAKTDNNKATESVVQSRTAPAVVKVRDIKGNMVDKRFAFTNESETRLNTSLAAVAARAAAKEAKPAAQATAGKPVIAAKTPDQYNPLLHVPSTLTGKTVSITADKHKIEHIAADQEKKENASVTLTPPANYTPVSKQLHIARGKTKVVVTPQRVAKTTNTVQTNDKVTSSRAMKGVLAGIPASSFHAVPKNVQENFIRAVKQNNLSEAYKAAEHMAHSMMLNSKTSLDGVKFAGLVVHKAIKDGNAADPTVLKLQAQVGGVMIHGLTGTSKLNQAGRLLHGALALRQAGEINRITGLNIKSVEADYNDALKNPIFADAFKKAAAEMPLEYIEIMAKEGGKLRAEFAKEELAQTAAQRPTMMVVQDQRLVTKASLH